MKCRMQYWKLFIKESAIIAASLCASSVIINPVCGQNQEKAVPEPVISMVRAGEDITITFSGVLESADKVTGSWAPVAGAVSPFNPDHSAIQRFFRARKVELESIFSSDSIVEFTLNGPFQTYFEKAFAGSPDGIFPPHREKPYFSGE